MYQNRPPRDALGVSRAKRGEMLRVVAENLKIGKNGARFLLFSPGWCRKHARGSQAQSRSTLE